MDFDWESLIYSVHSAEAAPCAPTTDKSVTPTLLMGDDRLYFRNFNNTIVPVHDISDLPISTFHFQGKHAHYSILNDDESAICRQFTSWLRRGYFKIAPPFDNVNKLCDSPYHTHIVISASQPVPVLFTHDVEVRAEITEYFALIHGELISLSLCHFGGSQCARLQAGRLYLVGGESKSEQMERLIGALECRYSMRVVKERIVREEALVVLFTTNLYIVRNECVLLAVAGDVVAGGKYVLRKAMPGSATRLSYVLQRVESRDIEMNELLHRVNGTEVYAETGLEKLDTTAYLATGFEPLAEEMAVFRKKIRVMTRRTSLRRSKMMEITELAEHLSSTPAQLLAYFCHDQEAMRLLSGAVCHVGECEWMGSPFFVASRMKMRKLLGYTLILLEGKVYRVGDGKRMFLSLEGFGHLTADAEIGIEIEERDLEIRVGARGRGEGM